MTHNPYKPPVSTVSSSKERYFLIRALQTTGIVMILYWCYKLEIDIRYLNVIVERAQGDAWIGPIPRILQDVLGISAGFLMAIRAKWLFFPLALHLCILGVYYFRLAGWPMATGTLHAPDLFAILVAEAALFGLAIFLVRSRNLL